MQADQADKSKEQTLSNRFEARNMERGMDPHGTRQAEADSCRVDDPGHREGAHEPWGQFPGFHYQWQVSGGKPDLLTRGIVRGREATPISIPTVSVGGAEQSGASL